MAIRILLACIFAATFSLTACTHKTVVVHDHHHKHHLPPGQAKKVYGSKSAKSHAPGQKKKHKSH